jgi:Sulfotransferase family
MAFEIAYSRLDRLFHRLAFASPNIQLAAEDIETSAFGRTFRAVSPARPVLLTSLPRAGTTMVLERLHLSPDLACTTYRDMPFVMAPVLWSKLSGRFRRTGEARERAHGDGVVIGHDSPEGFEEVIWRAFWPEHYRRDGISPWATTDAKAEARGFLLRHMQKIIALRRPGRAGARYLSKNNANIARLALLPAMFPDATLLVILRDPFEHAASLHRQHANFAARHAADPFAARYMGDIGHYEFGALHRPILFPGFAELRGGAAGQGPESRDYWLAYWIAAFAAVAAAREGLGARLLIAGYEALCAADGSGFAALRERLGLAEPDGLAGAAPALRLPARRAGRAGFDAGLADRAEALHAVLAAGP